MLPTSYRALATIRVENLIPDEVVVANGEFLIVTRKEKAIDSVDGKPRWIVFYQDHGYVIYPENQCVQLVIF